MTSDQTRPIKAGLELPNEAGVWFDYAEHMWRINFIDDNMTEIDELGHLGQTHRLARATTGGWSKAVPASQLAALESEVTQLREQLWEMTREKHQTFKAGLAMTVEKIELESALTAANQAREKTDRERDEAMEIVRWLELHRFLAPKPEQDAVPTEAVKVHTQPAQPRSEREKAERKLAEAREIVRGVITGPVHARDDHNDRECNWCKLHRLLTYND